MAPLPPERTVAVMTTDLHPQPLNVLIAGGGVAALEAMMALRALAGERVDITLLAPGRDFHYRPMAVAEPFTIAHARRLGLASIAGDFGARLVTGALAGVDAGEGVAITAGGNRIAYDALVIACGTRMRPAFEQVLTIDDRNLGGTLRGLVQDVEEGYTTDIAFVAPAQAFWPLPLYELALLTAHRAFDMNVDVDISVVSPENAPLDLFGAAISGELTRLLREAGVTFRGSIAGIPADPHGFIPVTELGAVSGLDGVYAAGDVTAGPIKHGGLASRQADVVAAAIAARAGAGVQPRPLRTVLRGVLLTGREPRFLEAELVADGGFSSTVSDVCPWDPPSKIVAAHLGPYLARHDRQPVRV